MKSVVFSRIACFIVLAGASASVAVSSPTRGPQAGPRDTVVIGVKENPTAQLASVNAAEVINDAARAKRKSCADARRAGPRGTVVIC